MAIAAALLVSGCGGSSSDDGGDKDDKGGSAQSGGGDSGGGGGADGPLDPADLAGGWLSDGSPKLVLGITKRIGTVTDNNDVACTGPLKPEGQAITFAFTCKSGSDYSKGTIKSVEDKMMTVEWANGQTTTFTQHSDASGAPEAPTDLPTDLPTDAGDLPTDPADLG
ncbi:hypothetical protein E0L36_25115 [Streptomyces sp. AJS327]|uniref:hypothetical protein n=1 Tax=Streptomyces sp. AJS327 TaxID=2545265 RepID=UPI0015DF229D|nr:hypothetical protein [Streptomyces sp. AJS327]MBA0054011.1 hypothetical protein [Streptomyces sp. AJS327]